MHLGKSEMSDSCGGEGHPEGTQEEGSAVGGRTIKAKDSYGDLPALANPTDDPYSVFQRRVRLRSQAWSLEEPRRFKKVISPLGEPSGWYSVDRAQETVTTRYIHTMDSRQERISSELFFGRRSPN